LIYGHVLTSWYVHGTPAFIQQFVGLGLGLAALWLAIQYIHTTYIHAAAVS